MSSLLKQVSIVLLMAIRIQKRDSSLVYTTGDADGNPMHTPIIGTFGRSLQFDLTWTKDSNGYGIIPTQ